LLNFGNIGHSWNENWLFKLANDNSTFLYLAFQDETYSGDFYEGAISNKPSIRESIDLAESTAKTGNVSITIADYIYDGSPISEELFGGSNHYINQEVTVHSRVNTETPVQIGSFRLTDISTDGDKISLTMTAHRPWDFISIPQTQLDNVYTPLFYGRFDPLNLTTYGNENVIEETNYGGYPVPRYKTVESEGYYLIEENVTETQDDDGQLFFWDNNLNTFIYVTSSDSDVTYDSDIGYMKAPLTLTRGGRVLPTTFSAITTPTGKTTFTSPTRAYDDDAASYAVLDEATEEDDTDTWEYRWSGGKNFTGKSTANTNKAYLVHELIINSYDINYTINLYRNNSLLETLTQADGGFAKKQHSFGAGSTSHTIKFVILTQDGTYPDDVDFEYRIYEIGYVQEAQSPDDDSAVDMLYLNAKSGHPASWDSSVITEIHDAHRDMLIRYAGLTTSDPTGWSDLNTARSGWNIRWWALEPEEIEKTLNKIAYEGCFIFRFKADGSPQYIFVPDSPTADKTLTKNDIKGFQVKPSNFSNLLTKMDISYEKHPAESRYLTSVSSVNSTARTNWYVQTKENIKQVKLDAYVAPAIPTTPSANPNDDFYSYYDNIFGDIKLVVSGSIVNPEFYNIEVGDIVDFSNMYPTKAFGQSWSGKNFMITGLTRSIGTLKFEGRAI